MVEVLDIIQGRFSSCGAGATLTTSLGTLDVTKSGAGVGTGLGVGVGVGNLVGVAGTEIVGTTIAVGASVGCSNDLVGAGAGAASSPHANPNIIINVAIKLKLTSFVSDLIKSASYNVIGHKGSN